VRRPERTVAKLGACALIVYALYNVLDQVWKVYETPGRVSTVWETARRMLAEIRPVDVLLLLFGFLCFAVATYPSWQAFGSRLLAAIGVPRNLRALQFLEQPKDQRLTAWMADRGPYGHAVIHNPNDITVHQVEVHLVRLLRIDAKGAEVREQFVLDGLPIALVTRDKEKQKSVHAKDEEAFVLCEAHWRPVPEDPEQIEHQVTQITIAPGYGGKALLLPANDRYRFEVVAKGTDVPLSRQTYILDSSSSSFAFHMERKP
jgi:hypothetical protein